MNNDIDIKKIYQEMELELISSMKRNLSRHLKEETKVGFEFTQWQAETLKEVKRFQKENKAIINNYTKPLSTEISKQLKNELKQGSKQEFKRYKNIIGKDYKYSDNLRHSFFYLNDRKIVNLIKEVRESTRTANTACFRMMNDQYRKVISKAVMFSNHGVISPRQAIDMATREFLGAGINCIEYKDGRRVNIADYCDMAVRTANTRAQLIGEGQFRQEIGEHLVKPTRHNTSCEKCAKWEGRILIDDVYSGGTKKDGKYPLLSEAMADGFFHPRCRHGLPTYYKELDEVEFDDNGPTETTLSNYQNDLNYINNNIQKYERLIVGSLCIENINKYKERKEIYEGKKKAMSTNSNQMYNDDKILNVSNSVYNKFKENGFENLSIANKDGDMIGSIFTINSNSNVSYSKEQIALMKNHNRDLIAIHNHPNNHTFSLQDIKETFNSKAINGIIVTTEDYNYYFFPKILDMNMSENQLSYFMKWLEDELYILNDEMLNKYPQLSNNELTHLSYEEIFKKLEWKYGRKRKK